MDVFLKILKRPRCIKAKIINNLLTTADKIITDSSSSSSSNDVLVNNDTYNNIIDDKLLQLLKEHLTIDEQNLFVNQFNLYLQYGDNDSKYVVNFDDIWKWLGYKRKDYCKELLEKHFIKNKDYIDYFPKEIVFRQLTENSKTIQNERNIGRPNEFIYLNVKTFKKLCMKANTSEADEIHDYFLKIERINNIYFKDLIVDLKQKSIKKSIKDEIQYTSNISTIQIPSTPLTDFNKSGIYFVIYGKKLIYDLTNVPENALIIGFGSSKNGYERIKQHKKETGEETRVLDFISTPHYEYFEREFDKMLQSENKIVKS